MCIRDSCKISSEQCWNKMRSTQHLPTGEKMAQRQLEAKVEMSEQPMNHKNCKTRLKKPKSNNISSPQDNRSKPIQTMQYPRKKGNDGILRNIKHKKLSDNISELNIHQCSKKPSGVRGFPGGLWTLRVSAALRSFETVIWEPGWPENDKILIFHDFESPAPSQMSKLPPDINGIHNTSIATRLGRHHVKIVFA